MPRKNSNARPKPKRRNVRQLVHFVSPTASEANARFYDIGSALLPGTAWNLKRGAQSRTFTPGPDTASSARKPKEQTD